MRRKKIRLTATVFACVLSMGLSLFAQDQDNTFYGNFRIGFRSVDTSGADFKYREDINLDTGVRLFDFSLHFTPSEQYKKLFDRIDINIYNFGGDPYETLGLSIQKYGKYKFQYDRRKATYFYHDQHEVSGIPYDHRTFNFDRIMDSALFKIMFGKRADFYVNFDRYSKSGESVTTLDINRIEFEFDKPVREESKQLAVGVDLHLKRYSVVFEEKIQEYEDTNSFFLPGFADGGAGARYPSSLDYFFLNQPYDFRTYTHTVRFNARPFDSLLVKGSAQYSDQDLNLTYSESASGIDYTGAPFTSSDSGQGSFNRIIQLYDFDLTYLLSNKLAAVGAVRYHDFEQDGSLTIDGSTESADLGFDTLGLEGGLQYQFSPKMALTLGYRYETRDLEGTETVTNETESLRHGFFGNLKWDFLRAFKLTLDYQRGYYDGPYTLISPTLFDRFRATAKWKLRQFDFSGSYLYARTESEIPSELWESTRSQLKLRAGYNTENFKIFAGYSLIDVRHESNRTIAYPPSWSGPAGTFLWTIDYDGKSHLFDGSLSLKLGDKWQIGSYANIYSNTGNEVFWDITRTMAKGYIEYLFSNGFSTQLGYRFVDFKEKDSGFNDYTAHIFEISFGYRWE